MKKTSLSTIPEEYKNWLTQLKTRIQGARQQVLLSANQTQIRLYYDIGREILERQEKQGWGAKVIDRLSADLREAFPDMKGFSSRNLLLMRRFAQNYPDLQIAQQSAAQLPDSLNVQQTTAQLHDFQFGQQSAGQLSSTQIRQQSVAQLPWFHIVLLLTKISEPTEREWYAQQAIQNGWPRVTLESNIKSSLYQRRSLYHTSILVCKHIFKTSRRICPVRAAHDSPG